MSQNVQQPDGPVVAVPETPSPKPKRTRVFETMTPEERKERAKQAASKRWASPAAVKVDWESIPLEEGLAKLADLSAELESARAILARRHEVATHDQKVVQCFSCQGSIEPGKQAGSRTRHNPETGIMETAYACSAACFLVLCRDFPHQRTRTAASIVGTDMTKV